MPPPPAQPQATKLGIAATSAPQAHAPAPGAPSAPQVGGSAPYRAHLSRQPKKSYTGLITAAVAVVLLGGSAFMNRDLIAAKWKAMRGPSAAEIAAAAAAAAEAAKPPPPPPELTASDIVQKVAAVYKDLPSFTSTGKTTAVLDMSAISPALAAAGLKTASYDMTLKMSKPLSFQIELTVPSAMTNASRIGWSLGNGDFVQENYQRVTVKSHDDLFRLFDGGDMLGVGVNPGVGEVVRLFTEDPNADLTKPGIEWTRMPDDKLNGQPCYVLAGTVKYQNLLVWISRSSLLILQTQVVLDSKSDIANMDDDKVKEELKAQNHGVEPTLAQIANFKKLGKINGKVTDTYTDIKTNVTLAMTDIQPPMPVIPAAAMGGGMQGGYGGYGGGEGMGGGGGGGGGGGRGGGGGGGGGRRGR
jgi:uncharacterized membrane protein YgcG